MTRTDSSPALFMKIRRESVQTLSETGTWRREALRHARAVCRRAERRACPSQPRIRACSKGVAYRPTGSDGPSTGTAMAVRFIALFKGEHIQCGIALTGTIEPGGQIGPVGAIPDKIRAAAREGYRTVLVPRGQIHDARWSPIELGFQLNVTVKEVDTIDEAYQLMTGQRI